MHVLITGGAGFIGSHLADALLARGDTVTVLDNLFERVHPSGQPPAFMSDAVNFIKGDVTDPSVWTFALDGIEAVVHLAAYQDYQPDFSRFARVNGAGTALLYEVAVGMEQPPRKVVVAGSQAIYGEGTYTCADHGQRFPAPRTLAQLESGRWQVSCDACGCEMKPVPCQEAHPNPHNAYAISKQTQEGYALVLGERYGIPSTALRYSIVQGPRQSPANAYSGVLRAFTSRLLRDEAPLVFEDGRQLRDYTHIEDVVAATILALDDSRADFDVFNVGSGSTITVLDYARLIADVLGRDIEPDVSGRFRVGDTRHVWSDTSKLQALGWRTTKSMREVVEDYVDGLDRSTLDSDWVGQALEAMEASGTVRRTTN